MMPEIYEGQVNTMARLATAADWLESGHFEPDFSEPGDVISSQIRIAGELGSWVILLQTTLSVCHPDGGIQDCVDATILLPTPDDPSNTPAVEVYWTSEDWTRHSTLANFAMAYFEADEV